MRHLTIILTLRLLLNSQHTYFYNLIWPLDTNVEIKQTKSKFDLSEDGNTYQYFTRKNSYLKKYAELVLGKCF